MENAKNINSLGQKVAGGLVAGIMVIGTMWMAGSAGASDSYSPLVPDAQKVYDQALKTLEAAESNLVNAKIMDNAHGVLELTPEDVKRLQEKKLGFMK